VAPWIRPCLGCRTSHYVFIGHYTVYTDYTTLFTGSMCLVNPYDMIHCLHSLYHIIWYTVTCLPVAAMTRQKYAQPQASIATPQSCTSPPNVWHSFLVLEIILHRLLAANKDIFCLEWDRVWTAAHWPNPSPRPPVPPDSGFLVWWNKAIKPLCGTWSIRVAAPRLISTTVG